MSNRIVDERLIFLPLDYLIDLFDENIIAGKDLEISGRLFVRDILGNLAKKSLKDVLLILSKAGWGIFKIVAYSDKYVIISGRSIFAKLMLKYHGLQEKPVDHFILGVLNEWGKERGLKFEEVECVAQGKDKCIFVGRPLEGSEDKT